jgi:monofunctional glycosyltransferase
MKLRLNFDWRERAQSLDLDPAQTKTGYSLPNFKNLLGGFLKWSIRLSIGFIALSVAWTLFFSVVPVPLTPLMVIRAVGAAADGRMPKFEKDWVSFDEMTPRLARAAIAAEDIKFLEHAGFDWEAITKAIEHNNRGRRVRGGSTISQQVAKNVFLWPARSWIRKGFEAYFTVLIETFWTKKRIMEVYLNVVELGDGIYGVEAASQLYFKRPAEKLSENQAALLISVLPNPRVFKVDRPSGYVRFRQSMIQRRMRTVVKASLKSGSLELVSTRSTSSPKR